MVRLAARILLALSVVASTGGIALPVRAAPGVVRDPAVGPNTRDDLQHRSDVLALTPAHGAPIARQPTRARAAQAGPAAATGSGTSSREVFGFAPYWALADGPGWNYSILTTVAYFGLDINGDGSIYQAGSAWNGWNSQQLITIINDAHAAGDRVVLVIKQGDEATLCSILTSPAATQNAITNTINAIASKNLDGVNVDFEGSSSPGCVNGSIQAGFTNFMTELSTQMHQRWPLAEVSADTYSGSASWDGGIFNITQLGAVVDALFIMDYDMYPNVPGHAAPNAPINGWSYDDALSVRQYVGKAPASKVLLGVPYYGYKWSTTGTGPYAVATSGAQAVSYQDIQGDFACAQNLQHAWDYTAQSPWATWYSPKSGDPCGGNYGSWRELYYDDATSLSIKYDLANSYRIRGAGMWALGYDGGAPELWSALSKLSMAWPGPYNALTPSRILDTRDGTGGYHAPVGQGQTIDVQVAGVGGVPASGAAAVVLNVTVTQPSVASYLTIFPTASGRPTASSLNFTAGQTVANLVTVGLGTNGRVSAFNAGGSVQVIFDVAGWIGASGGAASAPGQFHPLQPARLLDTRQGHGALGPNGSVDLQVTGNGIVPSRGVAAVALNLTVTNPTAPSWIAAYPSGATRPGVSNLNYTTGQTVANRAVVGLSPNGRITLFNSAGRADVVVDVNGWFSDASAPPSSAGQLTAISPTRIVDTRLDVGGAKLGAGSIAVQVAGIASVPTSDAPSPPTAVVLNVTGTNPTGASYLTVYPDQSSRPGTSDVNFLAGQTVPNLVIVKLGADGMIDVYNAGGSSDVVIDVLGWYN